MGVGAIVGDYRQRVDGLAIRAATVLIDRGVPASAVDFAALPVVGRRPGDANSEFLANRAMGDWAEGIVFKEINRVLVNHRAIKYGNADNIVAGDPAFPTFFATYQAELGATGKRPDLLIMPTASIDPAWNDDICALPRPSLTEITPRAKAGLEIRSSKAFALSYAELRRQEAAANPRFKGRTCHSFTPKVEDLKLVKRWIDAFGVPHFYVQVFFDVIYSISFEEILRTIAEEPTRFEVEENRNNQDKPTIHIPVTHGVELARFTNAPEFTARTRITRLFRLDAYAVPVGGEAPFSAEALRNLLAL